jgi:sugar lactone lactonase YvrE
MQAIRILSIVLALTAVVRAAGFQTYQTADVVLGQPDFASSITPASTQPNLFIHPMAAAVDPTTGKVFVSDSGHHRVLRFSSAAAAQSGSNPELVFGQPNFSSAQANQGGGASAATLNNPGDVSVDSLGRLWVADSSNNRVLCFYLASQLVTNDPPADIVLGQPDFTTVTSAATASKMKSPFSLVVGPDETLWVSDTGNHRVLRFADVTYPVSGASADGVLGQPNLTTGSVGGGNPANNTLSSPTQVCADAAGRLWVCDLANHRVLRFDNAAVVATATGGGATAVVGQPDLSTNAASLTPSASNFYLSYGIAVDASGALWVSDLIFNRVLRFSHAASISSGGTADLVLGQSDFTSLVAATTARNLNQPTLIHVGAGGSLLVSDYSNHRVLRFSPSADAASSPIPAGAPVVTVSGKKKLATTAPKVVLKGTAAGSVSSVTAKVGRKMFTARGTTHWKLPVTLKSGRTVVKIIAHGPGGNSAPVKITIVRL